MARHEAWKGMAKSAGLVDSKAVASAATQQQVLRAAGLRSQTSTPLPSCSAATRALAAWMRCPVAVLQISEEEKAVTEERLAEFEAEIRRAVKSRRVQVRCGLAGRAGQALEQRRVCTQSQHEGSGGCTGVCAQEGRGQVRLAYCLLWGCSWGMRLPLTLHA